MAIEHAGQRFGSVECGPKEAGVFSSRDVDLVRTLAGQAALALATARLAARVVTAQEAERRRIERNLHDGVQQQVVALVSGLALARERVTDPSSLDSTLAALHADAITLMRDLRELAHGIHPSVLTDGGLVEALSERCAGLPVRVDIDADPEVRTARWTDETEGAAYFMVMEALSNALKYARAAHVTVSIHELADHLVTEVADDGIGFDAATASRNGLAALADRVAALGGTFDVTSRAGAGTTARAVLPALRRQQAVLP